MSKINLKKLTMAFATAAAPADPVANTVAPTAKVAKPIATRNTDSPRISKTPKVAKTVKTPRTVANKERDPNSLLSNNLRLYTAVGTTTFKGVTKIWFANETATRVKNMIKDGHVNVEFATLPKPMSKADALNYLADNPSALSVDKGLASELVSQKTEKLSAAMRRQGGDINTTVV